MRDMEQPDRETRAPEEVQREVDERIDELAREGDEMEERLESAEEPGEQADPEEATEGGLSISELTGGDDQSDR